MDEQATIVLASPRIEDTPTMVIAGMRSTFTHETVGEIGELWHRFGPRIGTIPGETGDAAFGLGFHLATNDPAFDYLAGVEVTSATELPLGITAVVLPARRYAVFPHLHHVSRIGEHVGLIWEKWLPDSGFELAREPGAPDLIERYGAGFDPATGFGDTEIMIPVRPATD